MDAVYLKKQSVFFMFSYYDARLQKSRQTTFHNEKHNMQPVELPVKGF